MSPSDDDKTVRHDRPRAEPGTSPEDALGETVLDGSTDGEDENPVRHIERYRLLSLLGQGGQGAVYLAEDERIQRKVALKVLFGGLAHSPEALLRFEREAAATSRLNHPGIARIFELGDSSGVPFIAMEFVEGESLAQRLVAARESPDRAAISGLDFELDTAESDCASRSASRSSTSGPSTARKALVGTARFLEATARALHAAHESGLVHRDIKPANIMVRRDETPCILDFGLAHDDASVGVTLTASDARFGTPAYMAPEQVRGRTREIDRRTDVWALGATLYECCTLERPFQAATVDELYDRIKNDEPRALRSINPNIPKDLEAIVLTALDKDRDRRYATARELADDLMRFCDDIPVVARPVGPLLKTARWLRRNRLIASAASVVILALIGAAVVFWVKGRETEQALIARTMALEAIERERNEKQDALDAYERLADVKRLEAAITTARELHPPGPELVAELEDWATRYRPLADRKSDHEEYLEAVRAAAVAGETPGRWSFHDAAMQFRHDVLTELVRDLTAFSDPVSGTFASVTRCLALSRVIATRTIEDVAANWAECRDRILENPAYARLDLAPQLGLIPLGPDPRSGLEEFLHWLTHAGPTPTRDPATGDITVTEEVGIVLVLIPGGSFMMGSQSDDESAPNHDPQSQPDERPVHPVTLPAYFLSKYEMTQGQCLRASGVNPSHWGPGTLWANMDAGVDSRHPVENISWNEACIVVERVGLGLPTEAEWERAARAGRDDLVYSGTSEIRELGRFANINGMETEPWAGFNDREERHEDDFLTHAPVGSLLPNAFGLHDMSGNVTEWCDDSPNHFTPALDGRGRHGESGEWRACRGGAFRFSAGAARIAARPSYVPTMKSYILGLRPWRGVETD